VLTRDRIVRAAIELIEREGAEALSMRKVAAELDAAAMSLYHHVPNKAALLDAVVERIVTDIDFSDDPAAPVRERARGMMRAFRKISHDHPRTVNLVITRDFESPATLRLFEHAMEIARAAGYPLGDATRIAGTFLSFAVGCLMRETRFQKMVEEHGEHAMAEKFAAADPAAFPNISALVASAFVIDLDAEFEFGLDLLLNASLPGED